MRMRSRSATNDWRSCTMIRREDPRRRGPTKTGGKLQSRRSTLVSDLRRRKK
jgi:hypothetical protein